MTEPAWTGIVPREEIELYERAGFGRKGGFGSRPAIVVIDVQYRTVGNTPRPIKEAMNDYPTACGLAGWQAVESIATLLKAGRAAGVPILYPYVAPKEAVDAGRLGVKVPSIMAVAQHGYDFVEQTAPQPGDILLPKRHASAFFGTPMVSYLVDRQIDTIIIAGCTTSGCVRATVADGFSYNFRVIIPEECVYDRSHTAHAVNLFDMHHKYADVVTLAAVVDHLAAGTPPPAAEPASADLAAGGG